VLSVESLGRRFGPRWVFRRLEFSLKPGDVLAVTGANGSGKSTLLKVLTGLIPASEGRVYRVSTLGLAALDAQLYPQLTPLEHLDFVRSMTPGKRTGTELLEMVGLASAADRPAALLSSGMKARVKLAMALQHDPGVLLLDEPTASLDEQGRGLVGEIIASQKTGGAVILATNDPLDRQWATHELHLV
jgi:ABC-type multidrug transport system ATPase subunit